MAFMEPFAQLTGAVKIYLAPAGTPEPTVNATPSGAWVELGATDGEQSIELSGALTFFRDNDHQGPVKAVRPEEDVVVNFTLVNLTLEHVARVLSDVANVASDAGPPATKRLGFKRGANPTVYALLMRGEADSPYGLYPGQNYIPRCVSDAEPTITRGKDARAEIECAFTALEDDTQSEAYRLGWSRVQTS